ncbi:MAG: NAD-dependent epimerase/dehydratase family protein [Deltaproteobacteria bacterium]|nr:MAG: NAD-dependent epimerase/dehydratase family protein [Deltaproteobacteria bacterium]
MGKGGFVKTLVTGASGFIGSHVLKRLLARGREVRVLQEPGFRRDHIAGLDCEVLEGDIRDPEAMRRACAGVDRIFHLAAMYQTWLPDRRLIYEINVEGTKRLLEAAEVAGVERIVHTSTIATLGKPEDGSLANEETPFNLWKVGNDYVFSKYQAEVEALEGVKRGLPIVIVNPAFPFGEGDIRPTPTGRILQMLLKGEIPYYYDGGINVVDVEDVAEGHILAEEKGGIGEKYILGNENIEIVDFLRMAAEIAGVSPPKWKMPRSVAIALGRLSEFLADHLTHRHPYGTAAEIKLTSQRMYFDCTKARTQLGLPQTPIRQTLEKAIRWFREHGYA